MAFIVICLIGIAFVIVALPGAMRRSKDARGRVLRWGVRKVVHQPGSAYWEKDVSYSHPDTSADYLKAMQRHQEYPKSFPAPFPPPHIRDDDV